MIIHGDFQGTLEGVIGEDKLYVTFEMLVDFVGIENNYSKNIWEDTFDETCGNEYKEL